MTALIRESSRWGLMATEVPLDIPDFDGRLRLMAVAWTPAKVGNAVAVATVRDPVLADLSMPRFLAPGDTAQVTLTLNDRGQRLVRNRARARICGQGQCRRQDRASG